MNIKDKLIEDIMQIVLEESGYMFYPITSEDVLSKRGNKVIQMTRCIFVSVLALLKFDKSIIACYMDRSEQAIDDILFAAHSYRIDKDNKPYLISDSRATLRSIASMDSIVEQLKHETHEA